MLKEELSSHLFAVLFASADPVGVAQLIETFPEFSREEIVEALEGLVEQYNAAGTALEVRRVAGGFRLSTRPEYHQSIRNFLKTKPSAKLSLAALETLAVIAYRQPITLPEIADIRGVKATSVIRTLLEKKLIETRGRRKVVGRPIMYGTTREFLLHFGLNDLGELPTLEEFEQILADVD